LHNIIDCGNILIFKFFSYYFVAKMLFTGKSVI
jgi:hypothetical protein